MNPNALRYRSTSRRCKGRWHQQVQRIPQSWVGRLQAEQSWVGRLQAEQSLVGQSSEEQSLVGRS